MMPMWDAEWSLGLASQGNSEDPWGWYRPPYPPLHGDVNIWNNRKYFVYLFKDEFFVNEVRKVWCDFLQHIPELKRILSSKKDDIKYAQKCNFERWPILNEYVAVGLVALGSWEAEVEYINNYFNSRVQWLNTFLDDYCLTHSGLNSEESI